ncbi:urease accessory protein UreF [Chthonobacter albigriseus]|uniref:urease accessory protein UreF n=1 Tax=Chthonobacter albigriseus TaxID=1683161 RepID=UPI0015EF7155|nr:urease accessory UreF family protein [Chthonobacter albigriseus]
MPIEALLLALQHGDSAFPSGGFAFSWGLEELVNDGWISGEADISAFLADLLANRWHGFDRVALARAHEAPDLDALAGIDRAVEIATWAAPMRAGSRRAGRALLGVHARLSGGPVADYRALVDVDGELGHLPVVQGLVWRTAGLDRNSSELLSAWTMAQGIAAAGLRLGLIGHLSAQTVLTAARATIARLAAVSPPADLTAFTPVADVALSRHARRDARLFAT